MEIYYTKWVKGMDISTAGSLDKNFILELYQRAFTLEERKPFSLIERKTAMGEMEMLLIRAESKPIGFAIVAYGDMTVLLDYLAITEKWRYQGFGSSALELILGLYSDHQMIVEINHSVKEGFLEKCVSDESFPEGHASTISETGKSHKDFFLRCGMRDTGIEVSISGIRKELLCTAEGTGFVTGGSLYEKYEQIYKSLYGSNYRNILKRQN
ncbi:MAG: hypothetical protein LUF30_12390 [Lachnospiraceae bacterium]|nr:hypothetical protein [Lachnospiraceae bacterium]